MNPPVRLKYRAPTAPPVSTTLLSLAMLGGLFGLALSLARGGPWAFMILWLLAMGGIASGLLLTCHEVVVEDGLLEWRTAFRRGSIPMDHLERVVAWPGGSVHVFELPGGQKVRVAVMQGYVAFLEQLHDSYPQLPVPPTVYARLVDRIRVSGNRHGDGG